MIMGNIMKINMYADMKRKNNRKLKLKTVERNIIQYNKWLKKTNREDKVETYEEFLQAKQNYNFLNCELSSNDV